MDDQELLVHVSMLGMQMVQCMQPVLQQASRDVVFGRIHAAGRYPVLRDALVSVRGSGYAAGVPADDSPEGVANLLAELNGRGASWGEDLRSQSLRTRGSLTAMIELTRATNPACEPAGLADAMARIAPES